MLALDRASRFVDAAQTLSHLLTLGLSHPKRAIDGPDRRVLELAKSRLTIAMPFSSRMGHASDRYAAGAASDSINSAARVTAAAESTRRE